jgi:hypothetical protein
MPSIQPTIEAFFGTEFQQPDDLISCVGPILEMEFYDGFAHWWLCLTPAESQLHISANDAPGPAALPLVEVGIIYGSAEKRPGLGGGGEELWIFPAGSSGPHPPICITKAPEKRLSLAVAFSG